MKKLITLIAGVVLAASLTTGAYAQAAGPKGGGVQGGKQETGQRQKPGKGSPVAGRFLKQLDLTPDQQKQVKDMVAKFVEKRKSEQAGDAKANRKDMLAMRKEFMENLEKILTPEQREKLKKLQAEAKDKAKDGKKGGGTTGAGTTGGGSKTGGGGF